MSHAFTSANSTNSIRMFLLTWSSWRAICALCMPPDAHTTTPRQMERTPQKTNQPNVKVVSLQASYRLLHLLCIAGLYCRPRQGRRFDSSYSMV